MKCFFCQNTNTDVIETRVSDGHTTVRRRRSCTQCKKRFTTYERVEDLPVFVIKKDGRRERFDRQKLHSGIVKAVGKTTVTAEQIESIITGVEGGIAQEGETEIVSQKIGEVVAKSLKSIDKVAYIRFASVFQRFMDVEDIEKELKRLE